MRNAWGKVAQSLAFTDEDDGYHYDHQFFFFFILTEEGSCPEVFCRRPILKNVAISVKQFCFGEAVDTRSANLQTKTLLQSCGFPNFSRLAFLKNNGEQLLLN